MDKKVKMLIPRGEEKAKKSVFILGSQVLHRVY